MVSMRLEHVGLSEPIIKKQAVTWLVSLRIVERTCAHDPINEYDHYLIHLSNHSRVYECTYIHIRVL